MENVFEVTSGSMVCSDPCYTLDPPVWCMGIADNVKNGTWNAEIERMDLGDWGNRISMLKVWHKDYAETKLEIENELSFVGGVDSGQFGFFDKDFYRNDEKAKDLPKYGFGSGYDDKNVGEQWYLACVDKTLNNDQWGVLPNGVVSSSGLGDGSYSVFGEKNDEGEYIAFSVVFIWEDELEEDEGDVCGVCNEEFIDCICDDEETEEE